MQKRDIQNTYFDDLTYLTGAKGQLKANQDIMKKYEREAVDNSIIQQEAQQKELDKEDQKFK